MPVARGVAVQDPIAELARLAGEVVAFKNSAARLLADLDGLLSGGGLVVADVHPLVKPHERALVEARKPLSEMVRLGLVERQVQLDEAVARVIAVELRESLAEVGQDPAPV